MTPHWSFQHEHFPAVTAKSLLGKTVNLNLEDGSVIVYVKVTNVDTEQQTLTYQARYCGIKTLKLKEILFADELYPELHEP